MTASNYRSTVTALNASTFVKVADANNNRSGLILANPDASIGMTLSFNSDGSAPFSLAAGAVLDFEKVPANTVYAKAASGTPSITVYESGGLHRG